MTAPTSPGPIRLAELVASISLATDLATGQTLEHGLRRALIAVWLGQDIGLSDSQLSDAYYVALLGSVGCTLEAAAFSGYVEDEIALGTQLANVDPTRPVEYATFFLSRAGSGKNLLTRARKVVEVARSGPTQAAILCGDVAMQVGEMLDMGPAVRQAVGECHEQWNGRGWPHGLAGEAISLPARLFMLAHDLEILSRLRGREGALAAIQRRTGKQYDPRLASRLCERAEEYLDRLDAFATWDAVLAVEPQPAQSLSAAQFDRMAVMVANFIDSRSTYTLGHSPAVAALAQQAGHSLGLSTADATALRWAALLHDMGRAGVPVSVWEKSTSLTDAERERIERHPSLTEVILARSQSLGHLGTLAGLHHERLDGSGYRKASASFLSLPAQILAAADAYQTKLEPRPYRGALSGSEAAAALRGLATAGKLDKDVVEGVLGAAGQPAPARQAERPAGLSERECEVLCLVARGMSTRQIADLLVLSPKTVGNHIERIYDKIGVSTRVGATLFALRHDLILEGPRPGAVRPA